MTTLRQLRQDHPHLFYPQTWYDQEAFLETPGPDVFPGFPSGFQSLPADVARWPGEVPDFGIALPLAVTVASLYVADPLNPVWQYYLWCADVDHLGQRIYVGDNGQGLEIHRHLHVTDRWGILTWD